MSRLLGATLFLFASHLAFGATPPVVCPAGTPIGNVDLRVRPAGNAEPLPLKTINRLGEGDTILYRPLLRSKENRKGEVTIVLTPVAHGPDQESLFVLEPKSAGEPQEWKVPARSSVAAFVYGPAGLSRSKVRNFLTREDELIAQLADYAEKTSQTEALIQALSSDDSSAASVNAAFKGFASQYGAAQIDRTQSTDQQMNALFRTLNPAVASYDPLASQSSQRVGQTASLAASVAALFFGSPVGLAAGGTSMLMELHSIAFPNTQFRSSFAQTLPGDTLGLCGRREAIPPHTKVAFLWATRVPNMGPPHVAIPKPLTFPAGMKAPVPVEPASENDWKFLDRARKWSLESEHKVFPVPVHLIADPKGLEIDLSKAAVPPGKYHLIAQWDWDDFLVDGDVAVAPLADFSAARLSAESQDRLIAKSGRIPITVEGADFEFVTKVELAKPGDKFFTATAVPSVLPQGFRLGAQNRMDVQVNTIDLDPGEYRLLITQADGKPHPVPVSIFAVPPRISNLPISLNQGDTSREFTLKGERLNLIAKLEAPGANLTLLPASPDGAERTVRVEFSSQPETGAELNVKAYVENRSEPLHLAGALKVIAPRPQITASRLSIPPGIEVALNPGELPSGYFLNALLNVSGLKAGAGLVLQCRGNDQTRQNLRVGTKSAFGAVEQLGAGEVFLTFDDSLYPNGCELMAAVENAPEERSAMHSLGRILRIPKIDSIAIQEPTLEDSIRFEATLKGSDLETIDQAGWDPDHGTPVGDLPTPVPGESGKQTLRIDLAYGPATPETPLYVWLRGESAGRATAKRVPLPAKKTQSGQAVPGVFVKRALR